MRENFDRNLETKYKVIKPDRIELINRVYGKSGLVNADDSIVFDVRKSEIESILENRPLVRKYCQDSVFPLVRDFVFVPRKKHNLPLSWSNNNAESANHMLKSHNEWKMLNLVSLIQKLGEILTMQDRDVQRAMFGLGNYNLSSHMLHHRISVQRWSVMSAKDRNNRVHRFINDCRVSLSHGHLSTSTDKRLIAKAAVSSKKPSQKNNVKPREALVIIRIRPLS